ncbi:Regulation of nuclear pre-mRNA domain-containing protein 1A [Nosema granulosis]|uniref:Regulation of nuclear pre-mRNA domain-containing protein 1A n=1 Tax=Nosema granulosis TaxID=83296 RepID=A0A9P6H0F2_9MICR|nr:Regulation of nuclear pre-mRNA domain-containing protein 1A [Nosema granulosis]
MFLFSKDYFLKQLKQLSPTEEHIKTLGLYIKTFKSEYTNIMEVFAYVYNCSNLHHKLVLMYLANEILQTDKSYDTDSLQLKKLLREFIQKTYGVSKAEAKKYPPLYKKFCDLENVWEERNVLYIDKSFCKEELFIEIDNCDGNRRLIIDTLRIYLDKLIKEEEENNTEKVLD